MSGLHQITVKIDCKEEIKKMIGYGDQSDTRENHLMG